MTPAERWVWSLLFTGMGVLIVLTLSPSSPAGFWLIGCGAIGLGVGFMIKAWKESLR